MATTGYAGVPFDVKIKMSSVLPAGGGHSVVISCANPAVTLGGVLSMSFDDSNYDDDQIVTVTANAPGSYTLIATITAPYHLATHSRVEEIPVTALTLPLEQFVGTYTGVVHPSIFTELLNGDLDVYHMSVGGGDPGVTIVRSVGTGCYVRVRSPSGIITYQSHVNTCAVGSSSEAGIWTVSILDYFNLGSSGGALPSVQYNLYSGASLIDTITTTQRGVFYTPGGVVSPSLTDTSYTAPVMTVTDDFHGAASGSVFSPAITSSFNLGVPGASIAAAGFIVSITSSRALSGTPFSNATGGGQFQIAGVSIGGVGGTLTIA